MQGALGCRLLTCIIVFKYHVRRSHLVEELLLFFKNYLSKDHLVVDCLLFLFLSTMCARVTWL